LAAVEFEIESSVVLSGLFMSNVATAGMAEIYYSQALNQALAEEMQRDANVVLFGEDIGVYGGAFGVTQGLLQRFGSDRVVDTPISENSVVGMAVGAAMLGMRPVVEIMFMDFIALALDQILNSATKLHYMYNGQVNVPLVIRTPGGAKGGYGPSHSQMLSNLFTGIPGLQVVAAATPAQAKALLKQAIRSDHPVLFIENKRLYGQRGMVADDCDLVQALDKAVVVAPGDDVTLVSYSAMLPLCQHVRQQLAGQGVGVELIDLVSLNPLDVACVQTSLAKTGRVVVVEEACRTGGVGAEVAARLAEESLDLLEAPIIRVGAKDQPIAAAIDLEQHILPGPAEIMAALRQVLSW